MTIVPDSFIFYSRYMLQLSRITIFTVSPNSHSPEIISHLIRFICRQIIPFAEGLP